MAQYLYFALFLGWNELAGTFATYFISCQIRRLDFLSSGPVSHLITGVKEIETTCSIVSPPMPANN